MRAVIHQKNIFKTLGLAVLLSGSISLGSDLRLESSESLINLSLRTQQELAKEFTEVSPFARKSAVFSGDSSNGPLGCLSSSHAACRDTKNVLKKLNSIYQQMVAEGRIRSLTPELRKKFNIDRLGCNRAGHCSRLFAFYLPLTHQIYIDPDIGKNDSDPEIAAHPGYKIEGVMLHELLHAYQYSYRFPIDLQLLSKRVKDGEINPSDLRDYLDFFYEGQANYKVFNIALNPFINGTGKAWVPYMQFHAPVHYDGFVFGFDKQNRELLPRFERFHLPFMNFANDYTGVLSELVISHEEHTESKIFDYDFRFQYLFAKAIEKTYFGSLTFLFQDNHDDLKIYNSLYQEAYERLTASGALDKDPRCKALISKVLGSNTSPMVQWLTLPKQEIEACPAYKGLGDPGFREEFIEKLQKGMNFSSPFSTGRPGGEGSHPELDMEPSLDVLPQLEVLPEILN